MSNQSTKPTLVDHRNVNYRTVTTGGPNSSPNTKRPKLVGPNTSGASTSYAPLNPQAGTSSGAINLSIAPLSLNFHPSVQQQSNLSAAAQPRLLTHLTPAPATNTATQLKLTDTQLSFLKNYGFNTITADSFVTFKTNVIVSSRKLEPTGNLSQENYFLIKLGSKEKDNIFITLDNKLKVTAEEYLDVVGSSVNEGDLYICKQIILAEYQAAKNVQKTLQEKYFLTTANCITHSYNHVPSKNCMVARHVKNGDAVFLTLQIGNQQTEFSLAEYIKLLERHSETGIIYQVGDKHSAGGITLYQLPIISQEELDVRKVLFDSIKYNFKGCLLEDFINQPIINGMVPIDKQNPLGQKIPCFVVNKNSNPGELTITLPDARQQVHTVPLGDYNKVVEPLQGYNNNYFYAIPNIGYEAFLQAYQDLQMQALSNKGLPSVPNFNIYCINPMEINIKDIGATDHVLIDTLRVNQAKPFKLIDGKEVILGEYMGTLERAGLYPELNKYHLKILPSLNEQQFKQIQALFAKKIPVDIYSFMHYPITKIRITRPVNGVPKQLPYFLIDTSRTTQDTVIKFSCGNEVKSTDYLKVISGHYNDLKDYSLALIPSVTYNVFIKQACLKLIQAYNITETKDKQELFNKIRSISDLKIFAELITELVEYKKYPQTQNYTLNKAIKQLLLKYHPDKNPNGKAIAHQKTSILNAMK